MKLDLRRAASVAPALTLVLVIGACAATEVADAPDADLGVSVPSADGGMEADADAGPDADLPPLPCTAGNFCDVSTPLELGAISAISGRSKDDVWASGSDGLLLHWSGDKWTELAPSPSAPLKETLSSIFLTTDEMWGVAGTLVIRRGLNPESVRSTRVTLSGLFRSLSGVAVLSNGDVFVSVAPGYMGMSTSYFGKLDFKTPKITYQPDAVHPFTGEKQSSLGIRAISLVPDRALWLVGDRGVVVRYPMSTGADGGPPGLEKGVVAPVPSQANLHAASGLGDQLWAAGATGTIVHFDGTEWKAESTGTHVALNAIFALSPTDVWAAGDGGTVIHFDGATWSPVAVSAAGRAYEGSLKAIWASGPDDVWIGGEGGMFHLGALP